MTPNDPQIEKSILSLCLQDPDTFLPRLLGDGVTDQHFYHSSNHLIFQTLLQERHHNRSNDLISLTAEFQKQGTLDQIGGAAYLTEIYTYIPTSGYYTHHLARLKDLCAQRSAARLAHSLTHEKITSMSPEQLATTLTDTATSLLKISQGNKNTKDAAQACAEYQQHIHNHRHNTSPPGILTHITALDHLSGGMRPGELWVIAGPTGKGKSVLSLQCASAALTADQHIGIFSLEMGAEENIARLLSTLYGISYTALRNPNTLTEEQVKTIHQNLTELSNKSLRICDEPSLTIERIEAIAQQWNDTQPLDLIIIDYVQLIRTTRKNEARHEELAWITGTMKQLAKKLQATIITASQINDDGKLAKSRAIGHDADLVLRIEPAGINILKNRNGSPNQLLPLHLNGDNQRFE